MKSNLLLNKLHLIQMEYKELLTVLLPKLKSSHAPEALDEINLFWLRHIEEVQLYLRNWFPGENSYVFTAAAYIDYDEKDHWVFLLMGYKHVFDDPLSMYMEILSQMSEGKNFEFLYKQIGVTAENNLKLLENVNEEILILPLRLLNQSNNYNFLYKIGEQVFTSLFNGINSLDDYFSKCDSIDDIIQYAREDIEKLVIFSDDDDISMPFKERFKAALAEKQYMLDVNQPDSHIFYMLVFGSLQQAIDVIFSCVEYGCIPCIIYPVPLHYILWLSESLLDIEHIITLRFKMNISFWVYRLCDKNRITTVRFEEFLKKKEEYDFNARLFRGLAEHGIDEKIFLDHTIKKLVVDELENFYSVLASGEDKVSSKA